MSDQVATLESQIMRTIQERIVRHFLDFYALILLAKRSPLGRSDLLDIVNARFRLSLTSSTVDAQLHSLEDDDLITGSSVRGKRVYSLTEQGRQTAETLLKMRDKILGSVLDLFIG